MAYDMKNVAAQSGRILGEDGEVYNLVDLLGNSGGGGGSMRFYFGTSDPTDEGQPGDVYLNTDSGDVFKNENGTWNNKGNLQGPQGPQGNDGADGEQGPPGEDGADGADGVSVTGATSDGTNITFELSDGSTIDVPWPEQGGS